MTQASHELQAALESHRRLTPDCPLRCVGHWFRLQRESLGLHPGQLAERAGFVNPSDAGSRIVALEARGRATDDLIVRVGLALGLTPEVLTERLAADRDTLSVSWQAWADETVAPSAMVRLMPAVWKSLPIPAECSTRDEAARWLASLTEYQGMVRCLAWDRRTAVYIDPDGSVRTEVSTGPGQQVHPSTMIR
jgi:hypothetical protein